MSDNSSEKSSSSQKNLESSQENQKEVGDAESNPGTSGPTDKVREEAFEDADTEEESNEPA